MTRRKNTGKCKHTFFGREVQQILLSRPLLHPDLVLALLAYVRRLRVIFYALTPRYSACLLVLVSRVIGGIVSPLWWC